MKLSAGILPYKIENGKVFVYLGHFGGPFWKKKLRSWGAIKGEVKEGESLIEAAKREFLEETGKKIDGDFFDLGEVKTSSKTIHLFAVKIPNLNTNIHSNLVTMSYKGKTLTFPEINKARWFLLDEAKNIILTSQLPFLKRLQQKLF